MAMFCIEERVMISRKTAALTAMLFLAPLLSGCTQSALRISPDFGNAVHQDMAAQIADPDARYEGTPAPGSNGARVGLAQKDRKSTRLNSSHPSKSRMPSSA